MKQVSNCDGAVTWRRAIMRSDMARVFSILCIVALSIPAAWASETEGETEYLSGEDWSFTVSPYVWAISLKGSAAPLPPLPAADFDASFGDIWKDLNLGFFGNAELRKGKFGIIGDVIWADITMDAVPIDGLAEIDSSSLIASLLGAYRLLEQQEQTWLDLVLGARGYYINTNLDVGPGGIFLSNEHTEGWVDVMAGIRARIELGMGFHAQALLIGGGGGSSGAADIMGRIGYSFTDNLSTYAGYRYLKIDYKNSGFVWDVEYQGPLVGGSYKF
jgi:hypothetical protein